MKLTAELVEAFSGTFLSPLYDQPRPTPEFHREAWRLYCSDHPQCAIAAPRNHAKSTALTHDYCLASVCFRTEDYVILLGSSEEMAIEHLNDISSELSENEDLRREFRIKGFLTEAKTDIVVECTDGYQFRIIARGAEQKIRGRKWKGKRPGLIICDDMEDDEQVENRDRRVKFRRWFLRAAKQALRDGGKIRAHGTILHDDSGLANLIRHKSWKSLCYRAHASFDDFTQILWPEKFPEARLRAIRQEFVEAGDAPGYSQEYLNDPLDNSDAFFRKEDFIAMNEEDHRVSKVICAAADLAVSKADMANRTSLTVGGKDLSNKIHFIDQQVGRWNTNEWIDKMFDIQTRWNPEVFFVEGGVIWKSVELMVYQSMREKDIWINIQVIHPVKDKGARATPLRKKHRAGGTRWNKEAEWYAGMEAELLRFTGSTQATLDDQLDSSALLVKGFDIIMIVAEEEDYESDEERQDKWESRKAKAQEKTSSAGYF